MWFREDNPALKHWRNKLGAALNRVSQPGVIRMAQEPLENGVPQLGQQPPLPTSFCVTLHQLRQHLWLTALVT